MYPDISQAVPTVSSPGQRLSDWGVTVLFKDLQKSLGHLTDVKGLDHPEGHSYVLEVLPIKTFLYHLFFLMEWVCGTTQSSTLRGIEPLIRWVADW